MIQRFHVTVYNRVGGKVQQNTVRDVIALGYGLSAPASHSYPQWSNISVQGELSIFYSYYITILTVVTEVQSIWVYVLLLPLSLWFHSSLTARWFRELEHFTMPYDSTISFTLDTICPWTYLAYRRLTTALNKYAEANTDPAVTFRLKFMPYQLYPEASKEGEGKYEWYKREKYHDSEDLMNKYVTVMSAYGRACEPPINFKFGGTVANTIDAHRAIQHFQEGKGEAVARKIVDSLYSQYFENERHPSSAETLLTACKEAGLDESEAKSFIDDEYEDLQEVKMLVREQAMNGVDAVPYVMFEGKRRDITLQGAKEVAEYVKTMEQIAKESA